MPLEFKEIKQVTLPVLKQAISSTVIIRVESKIRTSDIVTDKKGADGSVLKPADVMEVTDLNDMEGGRWIFIANTVLRSELEKAYPKESYVGKCFKVTKLPQAAGKRYNPFKVVEIEVKGVK